MTLHARRAPVTIAVGLASIIASCSLPPSAQGQRAQESQPAERISPRQIVQLGFGRNATFAACIEPACPTITRKTLANAKQRAPASAPVAVDATTERTPTIYPAEMKGSVQPAKVDAVLSQKQPSPLVLYFPLGGAGLTASDKAALNELIPYASKAQRIVIAGRTDNAGSDAANQAVALARANTVRDYLRAKLPAGGDALLVDAQGSCCFIASNDTPEGRKQNRRVEVVLSVPEQVAP